MTLAPVMARSGLAGVFRLLLLRGKPIRGCQNIKTRLSQMFSFFRVRKISFRPLCRIRLPNGFRKLFQIGPLAVKSIASSVTVHASRGSLGGSRGGAIPKILEMFFGDRSLK